MAAGACAHGFGGVSSVEPVRLPSNPLQAQSKLSTLTLWFRLATAGSGIALTQSEAGEESSFS